MGLWDMLINRIVSKAFIEWSPFFLGVGIALYFLQRGPPNTSVIFLVAWGCFGCLVFLLDKRSFALKALLFMGMGFLLSHGHLTFKNIPRKAWQVWGPTKAMVQGTVQEIAFNTLRPTLFLGPPAMEIQAHNHPFQNIQQRLRLTLKKDYPMPEVGEIVEMEAYLMPIQERLTPNGFDFKRHAYFTNLAGTGRALSPPITLQPAKGNQSIQALRHAIGNAIQEALSPTTAAIAAALLVGDKSGIPPSVRDAFVDAGIAHVLAISGLHLSLMAGLFFFLLRRLLCVLPTIALRYDTKKIAALFALVAGFFYLLLAGAPISTQRAFLMLSFMILAIWCDRPPLSRRFVMVAALGVLTLQPIALFMPSFHLSFFSVMALITVYAHWLERRRWDFYRYTWMRRFFYYLQGLTLASFTASLATLAFTIYHFHKFTLQGVVANLLVIPLMSFWIMPMALLSLLLMPMGWAHFPLKIMGWGIDLMQGSAEHISTWPGASLMLPELPSYSLAPMLVGSFLVHMTRGRVRYACIALICSGFLPLLYHPQPHVFMSEGLRHVAVRQGQNLWVLTPGTSNLTIRRWAESLGYGIAQVKRHSGPMETPCGAVSYHRDQVRVGGLEIPRLQTWRQGVHLVYCHGQHARIMTLKYSSIFWPWN